MAKTLIETYRGWEIVAVTGDRDTPGSFGADHPTHGANSSGLPHIAGKASVAAARASVDAYAARAKR